MIKLKQKKLTDNTDLQMQVYASINRNSSEIYNINHQNIENFARILLARQIQVNRKSPVCRYMEECLILTLDQVVNDLEHNKRQALLIYKLLAKKMEMKKPGSFITKMAPGINDICRSSSHLNAEVVIAFYEMVLKIAE